jgi:hypothetical protein
MTDDERQRIIEEARATLDRTASVRVEPRNPLSDHHHGSSRSPSHGDASAGSIPTFVA